MCVCVCVSVSRVFVLLVFLRLWVLVCAFVSVCAFGTLHVSNLCHFPSFCFVGTISLLDSDWHNCWEGEEQMEHTRTLRLGRSAACTGLAGAQGGIYSCELGSLLGLLRTIPSLPTWMTQLMETEATCLVDRALRVHQKTAGKAWRFWLEENTTGGAATVHQLIRSTIGFQRVRGNAVDEQLKLRATWAGIWQAETQGPVLLWPEDDRPLFHRLSTDAMRRPLSSFRSVTRLAYDSVPPRPLSVLPDLGIGALINFIVLPSSNGPTYAARSSS